MIQAVFLTSSERSRPIAAEGLEEPPLSGGKSLQLLLQVRDGLLASDLRSRFDSPVGMLCPDLRMLYGA